MCIRDRDGAPGPSERGAPGVSCFSQESTGAHQASGARGFDGLLPERDGRRRSRGQAKPGSEGVWRRVGSSGVHAEGHDVGLTWNRTDHAVGDNAVGSDKVEKACDRRGRGRPAQGQLQPGRLSSRRKAHRPDTQHPVILSGDVSLNIDGAGRLRLTIRKAETATAAVLDDLAALNNRVFRGESRNKAKAQRNPCLLYTSRCV